MRSTNGVNEPQEEYAFHEEIIVSSSRVRRWWRWERIGDITRFGFSTLSKKGEPFLLSLSRRISKQGDETLRSTALGLTLRKHLSVQTSDLSLDPPNFALTTSLKKKQLSHVAVLHSDIQGYELEMLRGARQLFSERRVDYVFISTHGIWLHLKCLDFLDRIVSLF